MVVAKCFQDDTYVGNSLLMMLAINFIDYEIDKSNVYQELKHGYVVCVEM